MTRLLITGAGGFLGRYLIEEANAQQFQVIGVDRIPRPRELNCQWAECSLPSDQFESLVAETKPEVIIHAAGTASVQDSILNPFDDFKQNVFVFAHVLETVRKCAPQSRVVLISSAAVYGNPQKMPVAESAATQPLSPYGYHKLLCELMGLQYAQIYGLKFAAARVFSAYGEGLRKQVLWDICQKMLGGGIVELAGTGDETRDFIHARDVAKGLFTLIAHARFDGDIYNLANGEQVKIRDLAALLSRAMNRSLEIKFSGVNRPGDPLNWQADIRTIRELGFEPSVKFQEGARRYADWVRSL
jgi:UDP-glucose 4-epimerase